MNILEPENNSEGYISIVTLHEIDWTPKVNACHSGECDYKMAAQNYR